MRQTPKIDATHNNLRLDFHIFPLNDLTPDRAAMIDHPPGL
jgi:hypothetical protein